MTTGRVGLAQAYCIYVVGNEIAREGMKRLLSERGFDVEAWSPPGFGKQLPEIVDSRDQLILIDMGAAFDGLVVARKIRRILKAPEMLVICDELPSGQGSPQAVLSAVQLLPRSTSLTGLLEKIADTAFGPDVLREAAGFGGDLEPADHEAMGTDLWKRMSKREMEILFRLANGDSNKVIARLLDLSEATVKVHVKAILKKLRLLNRTQAAIWAIRNGLDREAGAGPDQIRSTPPELVSTRQFSRGTSTN